MRLHRRRRDPIRRNYLLLFVRRDTQKCQLLCVFKYEIKRRVVSSIERTAFLFIGGKVAYQILRTSKQG